MMIRTDGGETGPESPAPAAGWDCRRVRLGHLRVAPAADGRAFESQSAQGEPGFRVRPSPRARGGSRRALLPRHVGARTGGPARDTVALRPAWRRLRPGVGSRSDRHRDDARDARSRHRLAGGAAFRARRSVVGPAAPPQRAGVRRLGVPTLDPARSHVRRDLRRPARRHVPGEARRRLVVGSRRGRVRRHRRGVRARAALPGDGHDSTP